MSEPLQAEGIAGEGDMQFTVKTRCRRECDNCGDPATKRHSFCFKNGRRHPASTMYGRDDCSYCSDAEAYACEQCSKDVARACCPEGMDWGGTNTLNKNNAHMFLYWRERQVTAGEISQILGEHKS